MTKNVMRRLALIVVPTVMAVGAGTALAGALPNDSDVIHACVTKGGTFRGVDGATCKKGETLLTWNQKGPAGDPGATGPAGPAGPAGATESSIVGGDPLQGGDAQGSATVDGIAGDIDVKAFAFAGKNVVTTGAGGGAGKVAFGDVRFAKLYDATSPKLLLRMASGQHVPSVTFTFRHGDQTLTYKLSDVVVTDYEQGGDKVRPLLEHVELNFAKVEISFVPAAGAAPVTAGWDVKANKSI